MKKILLSLFALLSAHSFSQVVESVEFDFDNPRSLNAATPLTFLDGYGDPFVDGNTFTAGPVEITFDPAAGNGVVLRENDAKPGHYSLQLRSRADMTIKLTNKNYQLKTVKFEGYIGALGNVNSSTQSWMAYESNVTSVYFKNGTTESEITKIVVSYTRTALPVTLLSSTPANNQEVGYFKSMKLDFNLPMEVVSQEGIVIEGPAFNDAQPLTAVAEGSSVILSLSDTIKIDGTYDVYVPAGVLRNSEGALNTAISRSFELYATRATLAYTSVTPDPADGHVGKIPERIVLTFSQSVKVDDSEDGVIYKEGSDDFLPVSIYLGDNDHQVYLECGDGDITEEGDYTIIVPEGAIHNQFYRSKSMSQYDRWTPEIELHYTVENENSIALRDAIALLALQGIGYPAADSEARKALEKAVEGRADAKMLESLMAEFNNETNVTLPESGKWYEIAAINKKRDALYYLQYDDNAVSLTGNALYASPFKATQNEDGTFLFETLDGKYLHVLTDSEDYDGTSPSNVTTSGSTKNLTLAKLSTDDMPLTGFLSIYGSLGFDKNDQRRYAYATVDFADASIATEAGNEAVFTDDLSSAFTFMEYSAESRILTPSYVLDNDSIGTGQTLRLSFLNTDRVRLKDYASAKLVMGTDTLGINSVLEAENLNSFTVNTSTLGIGSYTLFIPVGTFSYEREGYTFRDADIALPFKVGGGSGTTDPDPTLPGFDFSYTKYSFLQYLTKNIDAMVSTDMNDLVVFAYMTDYSDLIADTTKKVKIVNYYGSSDAIAQGVFKPYPEFANDYPDYAAGAKALKLKLDRDFVLGDIKGSYYALIIEPGTFGDANFGKYLEDPNSISPSQCKANPKSSPMIFYVNDKLKPEEQYKTGDVNFDGKVNIGDVVRLVNMIFEGAYKTAGDVNNDGLMDVNDVKAIIRIISENQ